MKKVHLFILLISLLIMIFSSCDLWEADLIEFLEYYSTTAGIGFYELDGSYPSINGVTHIAGNKGQRKIEFFMRNPKKFELDFSIDWKNKPLGETEPQYGVDYTFTQDPYDSVVLTLTEDFVKKLDSNAAYGDISATIGLAAKDTQRGFDPYSYNLIVNTVPSKPQDASFVKHVDLPNWILAFSLSTTELRKAEDNDIRLITINGVNYSINIDHTDGSITLPAELTADETTVKQGKNIILEDAIEQVYFHSENTVYFDTGIATKESPTATISFTDSRGLKSESTTASTTGLVKTQYYVSETGNDNNTASFNYPYKTLQKAIDTILANNDPTQTYSILAKGSVGSATISPTSSAVHNIRIQDYDSGASISKLTVNGSGTRLILAENLNLTELAYASTKVGVSFASKPLNKIKITVPANTANNSLLARGSGANLAEGDFTLNASKGSLYVQNGSLYYSVYKQLALSSAIVSEATITAPKKAGMPQVTIQTNFTTTPNPVNVDFDIIETTNAMKVTAVKNATLAGFTGKIPTDRLENIALSDIEVSFAASFVSINLRAKPGYAFNRATNETTKRVQIIIDGEFETSERIEWSSIGFNKPTASGIQASGTWDINNSTGNFAGSSGNSTITLTGSKSYAQIASAIKNAIQVQNASVSVSSSNTGTARGGIITMTATLRVKAGYVFPDGHTEKNIPIEFTVIQIISGTFTTTAVSAKDGTAELAAIPISNFANASSNVDFHYLDVYHEEKESAIINAVQEGFSKTLSNTTVTASNVVINTITQATVQVSIQANEHYIFDSSGTTKKELSLTLTGNYLEINTTYFVSNTNANDSFGGTQEKPFATVQKAVDVIKNTNKISPGTIKYVINISGEVSQGTNENSLVYIHGGGYLLNITLQGLGKDDKVGILNAKGSKRVLYIDGEHTNVTLKDNLTLTGGKEMHNGGGGVYVAHGTFNMDGGTISGNRASTGGGVWVSGKDVASMNSAIFNMSGGTIENNTATSGGGVYIVNGHVDYGAAGIFNMTGGTIQNNTAIGSSDSGVIGGGGGVYISGGTRQSSNIGMGATFNMSGTAVIKNNTAGSETENLSGNGGGVYLYANIYSNGIAGIFNMSGNATIEDNTAYASGDNGGGGGVYIADGSFNMQDGTIKNNKVVSRNDKGVYGGGVSLNAGGKFTMSGGTIESNSAISEGNSYAGGVYLEGSASLTMSGGAIKNNTAKEHAGVYLGDTSPYLYLSNTASVIDNTITDTNTESNISAYVNIYGHRVYIIGKLVGSEKSIGITPASKAQEVSEPAVSNLMARSTYHHPYNYTMDEEDLKRLHIDNRPDENAYFDSLWNSTNYDYALAPE